MVVVPRYSTRERCAYVLPTWFGDFASAVEVVRCEADMGPGTKLLGALPAIPSPSCLIIVDDDLIYEPSLVMSLAAAQESAPDSAHSFYTYEYGPVTVGQGADGFSFYTPGLAGIDAFGARAVRSPALRLVDDLWISAFLLRGGVPVRTLQATLDGASIYRAAHNVMQLRHLPGETGRDEVMRAGLRVLLESGMLGRRRQATALARKTLRAIRGAVTGHST